MPSLGVRTGIEKFDRVDAGRGRPRHVADIVGTGAARNDPDIGQALDQRCRMLRLDLANLEVAACGDMRVPAAVAVGQVCDRGELPVLEDPVMDPEPAHVAVLGGANVKQPVIAPAEIVVRLRARAGCRHGLEPVVGFERMFGPLPLLLIGELLPGRDLRVLSSDLVRIGPGRLARGGRRGEADRSHRAETRGEAIEPVLLFGIEIHAHRRSRLRGRVGDGDLGGGFDDQG